MSKFAVNPKFNNGDVDPTSFEHNEGLIKKIAGKGYARAQAARINLSFEDMYQEVALVWVRAVKNFDVQSGYHFSTYFTRAAYNQLNRTFESYGRNTDEYAESYSSWADGEESGDSPLERISTQTSVSPEDEALSMEKVAEFGVGLSEYAKFVIRLYFNTPKIISRELEMMKAKAEIGREMGLSRRSRLEMDVKFILHFLAKVSGKNKSFVYQVWREIKGRAHLLEQY